MLTSFETLRCRLLLVLSAGLLSACQIIPDAEEIQSTVAGKPLVSFDDIRARDPQAKLGKREDPKLIARYGGAVSSTKLERLLAPIAGALIAQTDRPDRAFSITVLNSPSVNAFALPGGYLYITRGLLALANDEAEIAAVLAHEIAHVEHNHGVERRRKTEAADIANRVVKDVVKNPVAGAIAKASTKQRLAVYSRAQELQADAIGIKMLSKAGYDAFAASRFLIAMERFAKWQSAANSGTAERLSSHPSTPKRIELARRHARSLGPEDQGKRGRDRMLRQIDGLIFGDSEKEGFVRGRRFLHKGLGITFSVPPGFTIKNRSKAILVAGPQEQAVRFDAVSSKGQGNPVKYISSGWVNGLIANSVQATTINGFDAAQARAQAGDWKFVVSVIAVDNRIFRFIFAAPKNAEEIGPKARGIVESFRKLQASEKSALKPLRLKIVKVATGDTVAKLARRYVGVERPEQLFRSLNALGANDRIKPGQMVKLVVD